MKKNGFTLIELLVVITIIGVLAAVGLASYRTASQKARDSRRLSDVATIQSALEVYRTEKGGYPDDTEFSNVAVFNNKTYFSDGEMPVDPRTKSSYGYTATTLVDGLNYGYELTYTLEDGGLKTAYNP